MTGIKIGCVLIGPRGHDTARANHHHVLGYYVIDMDKAGR